MAYLDDVINVVNGNLPLEKLSGKKILITGATGLIGGCIVDVLMRNPKIDYIIYASGRNEERAKNRFYNYWDDCHFRFIKHEVTLPLSCNVTFDYIIHAASGAAPSDFSLHPVEVMKANIDGVGFLMEYGLSHGMKRMLYVSSGEVYGEGGGVEFSEDDSGYVNPTVARSCYPSSKRAAETLCVSYAAEYGADVVIARPCHTYGPYFTDNDNRVYAQFIRNILRGEDIVMKSTGEQFRSWCYVVDCVSALLHILLKGKSGEAYNIADPGSCISIKELAEMIASIGNRRVVIDIPSVEEMRKYNPVSRSVYSVEKLKSLGWIVNGRMESKMQSTIITLARHYNELRKTL